jgi:F-type H+-transporting ATPase subunit delta
MEQDNLHSPIAITYAEALLELAVEATDTPAEPETIGQELLDLGKIVRDDPFVGALLADPAISSDERDRLLDRVFSSRVSPLLLKFLHVLNIKGRLGHLQSIAAAYHEALDKRLGKIEVDVTVAQRLSPEALENVRQRVGKAIQREAVVHQYVDPSIIGGVILRVRDQLIDGSVKSQLESLRRRLRASQPGG